MKFHYFIASKGVLAVRTNNKNFKWSYGIINQESTEEEYKLCKIQLTVIVENFSLDKAEQLGKYHYFSGAHDQETVYYKRNFFFGSKLKIKFENLSSNRPIIRVNKTYFKYIKHRFMNLHSIHYIMTDLASLLLLKNGLAPLHCSAIKKGKSTAVIFAPPNSGKTLSAMMACTKMDAEFIAEDLAITDGEQIYSVPGTSTFRYYDNISKSYLESFKNKCTKVLPILELARISQPKHISHYTKSICHKSKVTHIFLLERGADSINEMDCTEAHRRIVNLNRYEFNYIRSPSLIAYEFYNKNLELDKALVEEKNLLMNVLKQSQKVYSLVASNPLTYAKNIIQLM